MSHRSRTVLLVSDEILQPLRFQPTTIGLLATAHLQCMTAYVVYWSEILATHPEVRVRFPALPGFLKSCGFETESTQPHQYN
jgi:hypothetical protein